MDPAWGKVPSVQVPVPPSSVGARGARGRPPAPPLPAAVLAQPELQQIRQGNSNADNAASRLRPAAARAEPWTSRRGYLELRHTSRDTGLFPVCAETPKQQSQLPSLGCFSLQCEPREPPDDQAVAQPLRRKSRRNCWDTQDLQN